MTAYCYLNGHEAYWDIDTDQWLWCDNNQPTGWGNDCKRECPACNKPPTSEGYDACLGHIKGADYACCGHGVEDGYIIYKNGSKTVIPR
jgi:hypothetical protein